MGSLSAAARPRRDMRARRARKPRSPRSSSSPARWSRVSGRLRDPARLLGGQGESQVRSGPQSLTAPQPGEEPQSRHLSSGPRATIPELCFFMRAGSTLHLPITQVTVQLKPAEATTCSGNWNVSGMVESLRSGGARAGRGLKEPKFKPQIPNGQGNSPRVEQTQDSYCQAVASLHSPTRGVTAQNRPLLS